MSRIKYIDALRGLAIFMVVLVHIEGFSLHCEVFHISILRRVCESIMLPLFFFISGFCFKVRTISNLVESGLRLVIPAIILGLVHAFLLNKDILSFCFNIYKYGYWFTITLFEMFVAIYFINKLYRKQNSFVWILILVSCVLYLIKIPFNNVPVLVKVGDVLCLHQFFIYFHYFVVGYILAHNKTIMHKCLKSESAIMISIILYIFAVIIKCAYTDEDLGVSVLLKIYRAIQDPLLGYTGLMIVVRFLYMSNNFISNNVFGRSLCFIGVHTLEIYLLHYFFLPNLSFIGLYLIDYPNLVLELSICLPLTMIVIICSLILGCVIRVNEILSYFFIGDKSLFYRRRVNV